MGENGEKMSKSKGNVVNPDEIVETYGADTMRIYEMFIGDYEQPAPWSTKGKRGSKRFIDRVCGLQDIISQPNESNKKLESSFHTTIKKVTEDIENLKFNTAIAALMALINEIYAAGSITREQLKIFTLLVSPFAPHIAEEIFSICKLGEGFASLQSWPAFDASKCIDSEIEMVLQINGKIKAKVSVSRGLGKDEILKIAKENESFSKNLGEKEIIKVIYVQDKLLNVVVKKD